MDGGVDPWQWKSVVVVVVVVFLEGTQEDQQKQGGLE